MNMQQETLAAAECELDVGEILETIPLIFESDRPRWQPIPEEYAPLSAEELVERIASARARLGDRAIILGHHYQREDIIRFADFRGDSYMLSRLAAERADAEFIVFCGVYFMAETADILSAPHQKVILPNLAAGCSMADMATSDDVQICWDALAEVLGEEGTVPVSYINSTAALKAFCAVHDGLVCTSSNAPGALRWAFEQGQRVLFFPDQHLGRNTGLKLGIPLEEMALWDYNQSQGGRTEEELRQSRLILWAGYCSVHQRFTVEQIEAARRRFPDVTVIVHPECRMEVVQAADLDGSTAAIVRAVAEAPSGSKWAIGTEINLVSRLARENPDKLIFCLDPVICPCTTMYRIHPAYLAWALENLVQGRVVNQIKVPPETARWAKIALERMLAIP